jgi:hypothetical protein
MKLRTKSLTVLCIIVLMVGMGNACAGVPPQRVALNSLQGIRDSVVTAVKVFNVGYQAGQYNDTQRAQLQVLYQKYLDADKIAAEALGATTVVGDPNSVVQQVTILAGDVMKFVQSLKKGP